MKQKWQLIIFCLVHALILLVLFNSALYDNTALEYDIARFFNYSSRIVEGQLPYQDFAVEYPPLTLVFFTLPRLVAPSLGIYQYAFAVEILLFDLLGLFLISALSRRLGLHLTGTLAIYTLALLAIGPILIYRYDLIPAIMVLLALYTFSQNKHKLSWAILAVGAMTKIYPAVIAPIFLIYQFCHRRYRHIISGAAAFVIVTAIIVILGLLLSPDGFWDSFRYQAQRGLHADSTYSSFLLLGHTLGLTQVRLGFVGLIPLSLDIVSPITDMLAKVSPLVILFSLAAVYWFFYKSQSGRAVAPKTLSPITKPDATYIIHYSLLAILAFMVTNKVFSPQFIIWLYPLIPLVAGRWRRTSWLMFIMIGLMTYFIYPTAYGGLIQYHPIVISILFLRNVSLIILAFLLPSVGNRLQPNRVRRATGAIVSSKLGLCKS